MCSNLNEKENKILRIKYDSKEILVKWTDSLNDLYDNCQRKFHYLEEEKKAAKFFFLLPDNSELEIIDPVIFKYQINNNKSLNSIIIKINKKNIYKIILKILII